MVSTHILSKSTFLKGLQCDKHLYLYKNNKELLDPLSEMQQAIFARGTDVGKFAQKLFPNGVDVSPNSPMNFVKSIEQTEQLMNAKEKVIYEAAFVYDDVLAAADIVVKNKDGWNIFEVKSSTSVNEVHLNDAAVQYWIISNLGYKVNDIAIIYINNQYVRNGKLDINSLFKFESVLESVIKKQIFVSKEIARQKKVLEKNAVPKVDIGMHCTDPYPCGFIGYCWDHIPQNSVFDISGMHLRRKFELYDQGIIKMEDIPEDAGLNSNQWMQIEGTLKNKEIIDKEAISEFLKTINYPMFFVDFESFQPPIPLYDYSKPYQQIPFQYSVHYKETASSELIHFEFLADPHIDPRIPFIENLIKVLGDKGDIIVYNKSFEMTRLKEIARDHPKYSDKIDKLLDRVKDIMLPFQKKYYYTPEMQGSYSIKYVLPALVPELSYADLQIGDGGTASLAYESLLNMDDFIKIDEIKKQLLEYCKLDTFAMVRILDRLENLVGI
ncbi:MAG: DUF2779 domain-containing protein [Melioribacteraceae bacterium]|nr:MAG: DUF2779 domain-containing protein [Melioribacteraceae bacterium]